MGLQAGGGVKVLHRGMACSSLFLDQPALAANSVLEVALFSSSKTFAALTAIL